MFLDLDVGQDNILHYALQKPPSERAAWFSELRDYIRGRLEFDLDATPTDIKTIMYVINETERALS